MSYIERNRSIAETSGEIRINDAGANNTINPYILQMIRIFGNPKNILLVVIPDILLVIGVVANLLLIYYLLRHKRHHSSIFALILCLALCDLNTCSSTICLFNIFSSFVKPGYLCPLAIFYAYTSCVATTHHLLAIAITRFYQLVYPLSARVRVTPRLCFKMSAIIWIWAMAFGTPFARYFLWVVVTYKEKPLTICFYTGDPAVHEVAITIVMAALPTFLTVIFHGTKHCIVSRQSESSHLDSSRHEGKRQTTDIRAVMAVIKLAIICYLPSIIHRGMHGIFQVPYLPSHIYNTWIFDTIAFANSIINPFIYAFASPSVRADLKAMFIN